MGGPAIDRFGHVFGSFAAETTEKEGGKEAVRPCRGVGCEMGCQALLGPRLSSLLACWIETPMLQVGPFASGKRTPHPLTVTDQSVNLEESTETLGLGLLHAWQVHCMTMRHCELAVAVH